MSGASNHALRLGPVLLDLDRGRLFRAGAEVQLRPKSFALLAHLAQAGGRVVPKDELLRAVWPQVIVTEDSLTQCIHEIRQALGPGAQHLLRTVPRRGYVLDVPGAGLRRDGVAVLPFALASADSPGAEAVLDGLAHDVIGGLARLRGFHVIARSSTFALRHLATDPCAAGRALGVAHVVTGLATIRAGRVHLTVEIVGAGDGGILWTGEFAEDLRDYAGVIGALTDRIAHSVHRQITLAEARRALSLPDVALGAWEHFHAGLAGVYSDDPARLGAALDHFRAAARLAPGFARAHAGQSVCHWVLAFTGMTRDLGAEVAAARRTAETGIEADDQDPLTQWCLGRALGLQGDWAACLDHAERAVALSPGFAMGHFEIGVCRSLHGDPAQVAGPVDMFLALSPLDPVLGAIKLTRAHAEYRLGHIAEAADWARAAAAHRETFPTVLGPAALILAAAGAWDEARRTLARVPMAALPGGAAAVGPAIAAMSAEMAALHARHGAQLGL